MVAYSFHKRFAPMIEAGYKRQTIRGPRKRHAKKGELIQLYHGMRTKQCRKLIEDPRCTSIEPLNLFFDVDHQIRAARTPTRYFADIDHFAVLDGFTDAAEMSAFWNDVHAIEGRPDVWAGVLIEWEPLAPSVERVAA